MSENRRKYMRMQIAVESCRATIGGREMQISVIDQSIEGMRLGNVTLDRLSRGDKVEVEIEGESISGIAQSITRIDERTYEVGIKRAASSDDDESTLPLLVSYINFQGSWICCQIVEDIDSRFVRIQLLGGKSFKVERAVLFQLTEPERRAMLSEKELYLGAVEFYRLLLPDSSLRSINDVIQCEFKPVMVTA